MVIFDPSAVRTCAAVTRPGTTGAAGRGPARSGTALLLGAAAGAHPTARIIPTASSAAPTPRRAKQFFTDPSSPPPAPHNPNLRKTRKIHSPRRGCGARGLGQDGDASGSEHKAGGPPGACPPGVPPVFAPLGYASRLRNR